MHAITKATAAKLIVLLNLPAILLLVGAIKFSTSVFS